MKKTILCKRLGLLLFVSLLLNSVVPMLTSVPTAIAMFDANPKYSWSLLLDMSTRITQLTLVTTIIPGLLLIGGRRFGAWASLPMCVVPLALELPAIVAGQFLLAYWLFAMLFRLAWLKARDLYCYLRAKDQG